MLDGAPEQLSGGEMDLPDAALGIHRDVTDGREVVEIGVAVLALLQSRQPDPPILVELVDAGAAGLAGGSDGGGGSDFSSAAPVEGATAVEAAGAPAPPPSAPLPAPDPAPPIEPAPTPPVVAQPTPEQPVEALMEDDL